MVDTHEGMHAGGASAWDESCWIPVPLRGFRLAFEMNPLGFVRRREENVAGRCLFPENDLGGGRGWGYRLQCGKLRAELPAATIFYTFGISSEQARGQAQRGAEYAQAWARGENRREREIFLQGDCLCRLLLEGEPPALDRLRATLIAGCPWELARISGDALGADPVLGF